MKKKTITWMLLLFSIMTMRTEAKIWRVNNNANSTYGSNFGGTVSFPVFQQLFGTATNSANGSNLVQNGDTIHLEGSTVEYAVGNLTKSLIIIGPGYFLNENPNTSNNVLPAILGHIQFIAGSSLSQLIGVDVGNDGNGLTINVSDIVIKRCKIYADVNLIAGTSNIQIMENFFSKASTASVIHAAGSFPTDVIFNNNIVLGTLILPAGFAILECKNNVFAGPSIAGNPSLSIYVGSFQNNIMTNAAATTNINGVPGGSNPINVTYNTGASSAQFGNGTGNIVIADMTTLFVTTGTSDGKHQLKPGSAAGSDGADRGAFGGAAVTSRYTLSGLPNIPVIYEINTSGVATPSGLDVNIKAKTIK